MAPRVNALLAGLSLLTLPLSGCYGDVEGFAIKAAKHSCKRLRECNKSAYVDQYDEDMGRCRDDQEDDLLDLDHTLTELGCDYVPEEGRECAQTIRALTKDCSNEADDDIVDACDRVYDCPGIREGEAPSTLPVLVTEGPASWPDERPEPTSEDALTTPSS